LKRIGLLPKLVIAIILGIMIGYVSMTANNFFVVRVLATYTSIFGGFLKYIVPFIILAFVAPGIAELGKGAGKLLGITTAIAYLSTITAGTLAFIVTAVLLGIIVDPNTTLNTTENAVNAFFDINIDPAMGVMTALVTAFLLGIGMTHIEGKSLYNMLKDFQGVIQKTIEKVIIPLLPIHIMGVFASLTAGGKAGTIISTFGKVILLIVALQITYVLFQYFNVMIITKKNPFKALKNMLPAYFTAIGTQSSAATIPVTVKCVNNNGVSEEVNEFVTPLCATIHLAGDTITLTLTAMVVMVMFGTVPTFSMMFPYILMLGVTMVAAPGIPGGGVMAALGLLQGMLGFNEVQTSLMIALHFAQDSFGTAANVTGDGAIALIINKISKKKINIKKHFR
jgi:Na+/H+-dicarboxylate symporter